MFRIRRFVENKEYILDYRRRIARHDDIIITRHFSTVCGVSNVSRDQIIV